MSVNADRRVERISNFTRDVSVRRERRSDRDDVRLLCTGTGDLLIGQAAYWATDAGYHTVWATSPDAIEHLSTARVDLLMLGLGKDPETELAWWSDRLQELGRRPRVIILTDTSSIRLAVHAERFRASTVLMPPLVATDVLRALDESLRMPAGRRIPLPDVTVEPVGNHFLVGQSREMLRVRRMIARLAPARTSVLIYGESGTGKELVARAIHEFGPRAHAPFIAMNCAAMPETLLESELFGHEKGAFTGAVARRPGCFERASGGTLFLDEIADMSPALQAKILRVVQEQQVERVGGTTSLAVNVRLIAASNRNLLTAIERGEFREDLYYRIAVVTLRLPSLAERADDMLLLISHFARRFGALHGKAIDYICDRSLIALQAYGWPGNVRELRNVIERAVLIADGDTLTYRDIQSDVWQTNGAAPREIVGPTSLEQVEARHIARVLQETGGSVTDAARVLGIHRNSLARKIRRYGLSRVASRES